MLAKLTDAPFDDKHWIFEDKYDGLRMIATIEAVRSLSTAATARSSATTTSRSRKR
jgi:ATP-dependent DNA ligase